MVIYSNTKAGYIQDVNDVCLRDKLVRSFNDIGLELNREEANSWANSSKYVKALLDDMDYVDDDVQVFLEYQLPLSEKRVDLIIEGMDDHGNNHIVLMELKQWTSCERSTNSTTVITTVHNEKKEVTHPSAQVSGYANWLTATHPFLLESSIGIHSCAYLHNYNQDYADELYCGLYNNCLKDSPAFIKGQEEELKAFISKYIRHKASESIIQEIEDSEPVPSPQLRECISDLLAGKEVFKLQDEQNVVYERILESVKESLSNNDKKTVIICEGGPGTGKTVIATKIIFDLYLSKNKNTGFACYATKAKAPRDVLLENLGDETIKNLFKGTNSFGRAKQNAYRCVIVDEAHRINKSEDLKSIIKASVVSVFFIDEKQKVTAKDIGRNEVKKAAKEFEAHIIEGEELNLVSQFRCGGSGGYISFLDNVLYGENQKYDINPSYDVRVYSNPLKMSLALQQINNTNNHSRIVAGYCYEWKSRENKNNVDIVLKKDEKVIFKAQWNFKDDNRIWATDRNSFQQIGCIHTSQGIDFEYCGVIIGKDLIFRDGAVKTDKTQIAKSDFSSGIRDLSDLKKADELIRNTYRTLLTRGQKGCFIYCEDEALSEYLLSKLGKKYADSEDGLTPSQSKGLEMMLCGVNCFVTGEGGTGKSYLVKSFTDRMRLTKRILICAPTGIAAAHVGGVTIHKAFRIPIYPAIKSRNETPKDDIINRITKYDIIIIDEISMCRIDFFEYILRTIDSAQKKRSKPIQIILCGDFFQLPPVVTEKDAPILREIYGTTDGFAFESPEWESHRFRMIDLKENVRQNSDSKSSNMLMKNLNNLRVGRDKISTIAYFNTNATANRNDSSDTMELHATNRKVKALNENALRRLDGEIFQYEAIIPEDIAKNVSMNNYPADQTLFLKVGAKVMFLTNDKDRRNRYQNGTFGTVKKCFKNGVIVSTEKNDINVIPEQFEIPKDISYDKETGIIRQEVYPEPFVQLPLTLAYAITIHKSQGQTFEHMNFDPEGYNLQEGQLYVALSRIKSIDGLYLYSKITSDSLNTSKKVLDFYASENSKEIDNDVSASIPITSGSYVLIGNQTIDFMSIVKNTCRDLKNRGMTSNEENVYLYLIGELEIEGKPKSYFGFFSSRKGEKFRKEIRSTMQEIMN